MCLDETGANPRDLAEASRKGLCLGLRGLLHLHVHVSSGQERSGHQLRVTRRLETLPAPEDRTPRHFSLLHLISPRTAP